MAQLWKLMNLLLHFCSFVPTFLHKEMFAYTKHWRKDYYPLMLRQSIHFHLQRECHCSCKFAWYLKKKANKSWTCRLEEHQVKQLLLMVAWIIQNRVLSFLLHAFRATLAFNYYSTFCGRGGISHELFCFQLMFNQTRKMPRKRW